MKRTVCTIKQVDYSSKEDFLNDIKKQRETGYILIENGMFNDCLNHQEIDSADWKYTAYFCKDKLV